MDSITQFVLGAAVSTVCLGKKIGPRKAALVGGALGTLPDLDVLIPFSDPIDSFVYHRGWSHSVFVHALAAPVIGEGLVRLFKGLREARTQVYMAVFLILATHAIIDAMTIYGTRLFWPIYPDPVGVGSIFIIDPIYSLPILGVVIWALCRREWSQSLGRVTAIVLAITSGYMALTIGLQQYVTEKAKDIFVERGLQTDKVLAIAAPFNTVLWKVIGLEEDRYHNLYISLLDDTDQPAEIYSHPRHPELVSCLQGGESYQKLNWFSRGYLRAEQVEDKIIVSDLRMGLTPGYVFRFAIGEASEDGILSIPPERDLSTRRVEEEDFRWLSERFWGRPAVRIAELPAEVLVAESETETRPASCS